MLTFHETNAILTKSVRERRQNIWDHSSAGRASALQAEGHRFEPYWSHCNESCIIEYGGIAQLARAHGSYPWCRWFKSSSRYFFCHTSVKVASDSFRRWQVLSILVYTARESEKNPVLFLCPIYLTKYTRKVKSFIIFYIAMRSKETAACRNCHCQFIADALADSTDMVRTGG